MAERETAGIDPVEVMAVLKQIESGDVVLIKRGVLPGDRVEFATGTGWRFRVFDDAGGWDYIDEVAPPHGEFVDFWKEGDEWNDVKFWRPTDPSKTWGWGPNVSPTGYRIA